MSVYSQEKDVRLAIGEPQLLGSHIFELEHIGSEEGGNYRAIVGQVRVRKGDATVALLRPEKRTYHASPDNTMTEAGIAVGWSGDWYVSLGEPLGDGAWSARLQFKSFVRFIWGGALLIALGAAIAAADRRYRRRRVT